MPVTELGASGRNDPGDRRRVANRTGSSILLRSAEVSDVQKRGHARPGNLQRRRHEYRLASLANRNAAFEESVAQRLHFHFRSTFQSQARLPGCRRQSIPVNAGDDVGQRSPPAPVAHPARRIERRAPGQPCLGKLGRARQRAGRQDVQSRMLGCNDGGDHPQEALELVAFGQCP